MALGSHQLTADPLLPLSASPPGMQVTFQGLMPGNAFAVLRVSKDPDWMDEAEFGLFPKRRNTVSATGLEKLTNLKVVT